jgi:hypothetical protein
MERFKRAGCVVRVAENTIRLNDGDCTNVRYVTHPDSPNFVAIQDLDDDHQISMAELDYWERRLGLVAKRKD